MTDLARELSDIGKIRERIILAAKIRLAKEYMRRSSLFFEISLILKTLFKLFRSNVNRETEI